MEIEVTKIVAEDCSQFSSSIAESGLENIAQITWAAACEYARENELYAPEARSEVQDWLKGFGAWDAEELDAMPDHEIAALFLQFVAGDVQEMERLESYEEYLTAAEQGAVSGNLYRDDSEFGARWYYIVSH